VPVLLRRVKYTDADGQGEYFSFLGECYVHRMMDGEAMDIQRKRLDSSDVDAELKEDLRLQSLELGPAPSSALAKECFVEARYETINVKHMNLVAAREDDPNEHDGISAPAEMRSENVHPMDSAQLHSYDSMRAELAFNVREEMELFFGLGQIQGVHSQYDKEKNTKDILLEEFDKEKKLDEDGSDFM
jgi:hypothetical protein